MILGVIKESCPGERRVALSPTVLTALAKSKLDCVLESGAGESAGFSDQAYKDKGARVADRGEVFAQADILCMVRSPGANPQTGHRDLAMMRKGQIVIGLAEPLTALDSSRDLASRGVTSFALELVPRITRAQSMDVLSSQATIQGYKAVLLAADALSKMFPMLTTAAGTVAPAKVFVIGAGVAGLQAIATARRLGAVVSGYDVRPAVKEQVESLGAKFVVLNVDGASAEGQGGYAKAMDDSFYKRQRELMTEVLREQDVVITTAAVPGKKAPILITAEMVRAMPTGAVIVDLAAERGGNCELTKPGETVTEGGVTILGPLNLASSVPHHASQMYAKNVAAFLGLLVGKDGVLKVNRDDEIVRETLTTHEGEVVHAKLRELMGLPVPAAATVMA
jgi:H+-translocating NAD(P) transhydrogenase subunit alpha